MSIGSPIAMIALSLQAAATVPVRDAGPLLPSGKWRLVNAHGVCSLSRGFGIGPGRIMLDFRKSLLSKSIDVVLTTTDWTGDVTGGVSGGNGATIITRPGDQVIRLEYSSRRASEAPGMRSTSMSIDAAEFAQIAKAADLTISAGDMPIVALAQKGNTRDLAVLKTCSDNLFRQWHVDPREQDLVAETAKGNPANWVTIDDYPEAANKAEGKTFALFRIATSGRVDDCQVMRSSGNAVLDETTCRLIMERAHYTPAVGKNGKLMAVHKTITFTWSQG